MCIPLINTIFSDMIEHTIIVQFIGVFFISMCLLACLLINKKLIQHILTEREEWRRKQGELNKKGRKGNPEPAPGLWQAMP